jgi:hypothetical protein
LPRRHVGWLLPARGRLRSHGYGVRRPFHTLNRRRSLDGDGNADDRLHSRDEGRCRRVLSRDHRDHHGRPDGGAGEIRANYLGGRAERCDGRDGVPGHDQERLKAAEEGHGEKDPDGKGSPPMHGGSSPPRSARPARRARLPFELLLPCFRLTIHVLSSGLERGVRFRHPCGTRSAGRTSCSSSSPLSPASLGLSTIRARILDTPYGVGT